MILNQVTLAKTVKLFLSERNMSKDEFAKKINKSITYVEKLLSGKANPTIRMICRIFEAFDKQVVFGFADENKV